MRSYNAAGCQLIGATAAALLFFNPPQQAFATTEAPATADVRPLNDAPSAAASTTTAPSTAPIVSEKATGETLEAKPAETAAAPAKPKPLTPTLIARINLTTQTMVVQVGNKTVHTWKVSSGAPGYATPPGTFKPSWMSQMWHSRQYDDAPMPYSVFFNGGIAVHGAMNPASLGSARSHGCVRVATSNAAAFYKLVSRHGMAQTRIIVHGKQPFSTSPMVASRSINKPARPANAWVYTPSNAGNRGGMRPATSRYDSYSYQPKPQFHAPSQPRRISSVRTQSTYWSR